ncbi:selenium cofactor biosynthesis protein YqeC [Senegalimassilia faecalis]|uniref:selenium cofactor biosynthesis protein YqeC n=1 Tax=Senegalimassilia faecalis TaxID=2509433 RepID=UPI0013760677|nr:selenium cofactor biosynthesis protein YqeC [Senegalimassilia faecalis]
MLHIQRGLTAIIGSGGKSTLLRALAEELSRDARVIVATSTKMHVPDWCPVVLGASLDDVRMALCEASIVCAGSIHLPMGKLAEPRAAFSDLVCSADYVLVEADGAKTLPLKAHAEHEPVIPACAGRTVCVVGVDGLGAPRLADVPPSAAIRAAGRRFRRRCGHARGGGGGAARRGAS